MCIRDRPAGVLNLVFGVPSEISSYLIPQPQVRLVAFTGSTAVGIHLTAVSYTHLDVYKRQT